MVQTDQAVRILESRYRFCRFEVISNPVAIPEQVPPLTERNRVVGKAGMSGWLKNHESLRKYAPSLSWALI